MTLQSAIDFTICALPPPTLLRPSRLRPPQPNTPFRIALKLPETSAVASPATAPTRILSATASTGILSATAPTGILSATAPILSAHRQVSPEVAQAVLAHCPARDVRAAVLHAAQEGPARVRVLEVHPPPLLLPLPTPLP